MVTLTISESQLAESIQQLSPAAKRQLLRLLITTLDDEPLLAYGAERARAVAAQRGLDWDQLDERQRTALIDDVLHTH